MDVVLCQGHGKPCMLKTGLREGPNKGKSFYICSQMPQPCGFNKPVSLPTSGCLKHAGKTIELQRIHRDKETGQKWLYYRCQVTKDATKGKGWCGKIPHPGTTDRRATKADGVDSKKQWRLVPPETTSDSDSSEEYEDAAPYQPSKNPFYKEVNKGGQMVASSGKKFDYLEVKVEKENLMKNVDGNKIYGSDKHVDPGRGKSVPCGRGAAARDDPVYVETGGSKSQGGEGGKTLPAEHSQKSQKGGTEASGVDVKTGKKSEEKASSQEHLKQMLTNSKTGEMVKSIDSTKQPQGKDDEVILLSDDDEDAQVRRAQSANTQVKQGVTQKQPVKVEAVKPKQAVRDGNMTSQPITAGHKKQQPITAFPGFQPASKLMSRSNAALRADLVEQLRKKEDLVKKVQLSVLPDGGKKLRTQIEDLEKAIKSIDLGANQGQPQGASGVHVHQQHQPQGDRRVLPTHAQPLPAHVLQQMYAPHPQGQTLYGGRMTATRLQQVAGVTSEAIDRLHKSLESCPPPDAEVEDPACLRVSLLPHQRQALAWLTWREGQHPSGGILADDMGLGKTLTMISLILAQRQNTDARNKTKVSVPEDVVKSRATLVVCPASLILHWKAEVERHTEDDTLKVYLYHGQNRTKDHTELAENDLVLSTYELVRKECSCWAADLPTQDGKKGDDQEDTAKPRGPMPVLLRVIWDRIILDEAHAIKNHKSQTSVAACQLRAHSRWAMTGTPIQNDLMDMYPLLRFMRCSPFDEMKVWKKWVDNRTPNGKARLNTLVNSLLLRRTKGQEGRDGRPLVNLPQCNRISHVIELSADERTVYDKFYQDTRKTFQNYLLQHGEKENVKDRVPPSVGTVQTAPAGDSKSATGQHQNVPGVQQNVKVSHILVQLLRLRQCCCHLSLMKEAVDQETFVNEGIDLTLEQQLREMSLQDNNQVTTPSNSDLTTPSNSDLPSKDAEKSSMFNCDKPSTKIHKVLGILAKNKSESTPQKPVKSVIVSQWTKMLDVIGLHLEHAGYKYVVIRGGIPPRQRMEAVEQFNRDPKGPEVLLVSLQAGGVGLNLIGGSHLFLLDMHWNPALEDQASDRVYRVGQKNNVVIHKFVCKDTVEEKIQELQKAKKNLAQGVLSGGDVGKQKLSLADLRQLFGL